MPNSGNLVSPAVESLPECGGIPHVGGRRPSLGGARRPVAGIEQQPGRPRRLHQSGSSLTGFEDDPCPGIETQSPKQ